MDPDFFRKELEKVPGKKFIASNRVMILCPFHNETKPSGSISLDTSVPGRVGFFHCWGCGQNKSWNQVAEALGLKKLNGKKSVSKHVPQIDLKGAKRRVLPEENEKLEDFDFFELQDEKWRGFSKEFLQKFGAKLVYHDKSQRFYIWFPVTVHGTQVGYFRAMQRPIENLPSYLNKPGVWVLAKGLFPFDQAIELMKKKDLKTVVLVEGPRDALRLIREGIPAVAIMGTNNWTNAKLHLIENTGVKRLILLMDGDKPGKRATFGNKKATPPTEGIYGSTKIFIDTVVLKLWKIAEEMDVEKLDPMSMPKEIVEQVRSKLR